jgi:ABC-type multidrug transport system ATPase subunit
VTAPVLELRGARVDVGGVPAIDGLSFATTSDHVVVLGAPRALFEAASGVRAPAHGEIFVRGEPAHVALANGKVACAPLDPPLPPTWTAREYVTWSARLAGRGRRGAAAMAKEAFDLLKMNAVADAKLGRTAANARRAVTIAAAIATGAETIFLEDPLAALPDDAARNLARLVVSALESRAWIAFAGHMPLVSPLALHADEAVVLEGARVVAQGAPAEIAAKESAFAVRIGGEAAAFVRLATQYGARVEHASGSDLTIELGELTTTDLMAIAAQANAVIVELSPLSRALK